MLSRVPRRSSKSPERVKKASGVTVQYFAPSDIQVARVDRKCLVHFCDALVRAGARVRLITLRVRLHDRETAVADPLDLYRVRSAFEHRAIRTPLHQDSHNVFISIVRLIAYAGEAVRVVLRATPDENVVLFMRNYLPALAVLPLQWLPGRRVSVALEVHEPPRNRLQRVAVRRVFRVIANSFVLADELVAAGDVLASNVVPTHQGVDIDEYDERSIGPREAREELGLPINGKLVVYTGKIHVGYKEVDYLLAAAALLRRRRDIVFVLVGGRADQIDTLRERAAAQGLDNVVFTGFIPPVQVPIYQFAADALVLYYPIGIKLERYLSPGKLFEYMASGRPIVAVDLPVLREVLGDEPAAIMVPPDSPERLAEAIETLVDDDDLGRRLAVTARTRVEPFTVEARAQAVIAALSPEMQPGERAQAAAPSA